MREIEIQTDYIKLDQFLKLSDIAQTGGHAKMLIKDGLISVNNELCFERGKKLKTGDIVKVDDKYVFIVK